MPRRRSFVVGSACAICAIGFVVFRSNSSYDSQPELKRLRELGVPLSLSELVAVEEDRFPIEEVDPAVAEIRQNPSYLSFMKGSKYRMGSTEVDDLKLALASQEDFASEVHDLEKLLWSVEDGFKWVREDGFWRPESERQLDYAIRFVIRRKLQIQVAGRDLQGLLESASLLDHLSEQIYKTPGNIGGDLGRKAQYLSLTGYASALQVGHRNENWINAIEEQTREARPKVDLRLLTHEVVPGTLESFRRSQDLDHVRGARYLGVGWIFPSYRKQVEYKWAKVVREHQEAVNAKGIEPRDYKAAYEKTVAKLASDKSSVGRTVQELWVDFDDVLIRTMQERARWASLRGAIAVLKYRQSKGVLPKSLAGLDAPEDPFTGADLRYVRTVTGFIVYSPGVDGDQGGSRSTDFGVEIDLSAK